ncbi:MAG: hypothetical protein JRH15_08490, partial [Deltaproteobacteria bacterium]|nr:hypothetical protein [Deltaproteobacteria bacterium]
MPMNSVDRVQAAISGNPVDRVPKGELIIDSGFITRFETEILDRQASQSPDLPDSEACLAVYKRLGLDLICVQSSPILS